MSPHRESGPLHQCAEPICEASALTLAGISETSLAGYRQQGMASLFHQGLRTTCLRWAKKQARSPRKRLYRSVICLHLKTYASHGEPGDLAGFDR
jgi:hypothetical protein